ncbi:hypothetical protein cypCar_00047533, partial [Cyprinus carpio]
MQRAEADKTVRAQNLQARAKMSLITRQLLGEAKEEILIQRLNEEALDKGDGADLLAAFDAMEKAAKVMETQQREQKDTYKSQLEALVFKNEHLNKENEQLQALFQEKSNVNQSIGQEVARLSAENMVIPELKQQVSELNRHKQELETQLQEQSSEMSGEPNTQSEYDYMLNYFEQIWAAGYDVTLKGFCFKYAACQTFGI